MKSPNPPKPSDAKPAALLVSLDQLSEDEYNARRVFHSLDGLVQSIRASGVVEPLVVTPGKSGKLIILAGHRRFRAAKAAGLKEIVVTIREQHDTHARRFAGLVSNLQREDLGPIDLSRVLNEILRNNPQCATQRALAAVIGKDEAWVSGVLGIIRIDPKLRRQLGASQVPLSLDSVVKIARVSDRETQRRLVEELLAGATTREVREQLLPAKGKARNRSAKKPKRLFKTALASVVIQSNSERALSDKECLAALRAASKQISDCQ